MIDAEGYETTVIPSIDFSLVRPEAIYFESHNLGTEKDKIYELLARNGYRIIEFAGDAVAVYDTSFRDKFHEGMA